MRLLALKRGEPQKSKLLLVEDDPAVRLILGNVLSVLFKVTETDSAVEAIRLVEQQHDFNVILTDVSLIEHGNPSGIEVAKVARTLLSAAKIVVMSGQQLSDAAAALLQELHITFLPKPFQIDELLAALEQ